MFSKSCEYAIRAVVFVATQNNAGNKLGIMEICKEIDAPQHFTAKILQSLSHNGIISSQKGPSGGFYLNKTQTRLKLIDVVRALDGDKTFTGCGLGLKNCSEKKPCPIHNQFKVVRDELLNMLSNTYVVQLAKEIEKGSAVLSNISGR